MAKKRVKARSKAKKSAMKARVARSKKTARTRPAKRAAKKRTPAVAALVKKVSKALAPGTNWVNPYLTVGDPEAAIRFYQNAFGFRLRASMPGPDGKIMHAELIHNDSPVMLGPENQEKGYLGPQGISPVTLYTYVENVDEVTNKASTGGAKIMQPPADQFWGDRCSIVVDPQGHIWMLATHVRDVAPEDMHP
jgi:PhnB protein